jgi:phage terminase large subunit
VKLNKHLQAQLRSQADESGNIVVETGYEPRPLQVEIHRKLKRFNVLVCHRRFGKTVLCLNEIIDRALANKRRNPQYAYIAPSYKQAKSIAWEYLKEFTRNFPGVTYHEQELRCEIPRGDDKIKIILLGAENPDSLRGLYLDGVVLDEFGQCDPMVWRQVVRPALSDRMGWAVFIGTPAGQNHFFDLWNKANKLSKETDYWYTQLYRASETGVIPKGELKSARMEMSESDYDQEFECSFEASLEGAYYKEQFSLLNRENRIREVPYQPSLYVNTYWDIGINDNTAVWFVQFSGKEVHVIDHMEENGKGIEWWVKQVHDRPYTYQRHYLPHDGAAKEFGTGQTRQERFLHYGMRTEIVPRQNVADGIDAVRRILPMCFFDEQKCHQGLMALKNYKKTFNGKKGIFEDKPVHDWASDSADAFRQLALAYNPARIGNDVSSLPRSFDTGLDW